MTIDLRGRDHLRESDFTEAEIRHLLHLAAQLRELDLPERVMRPKAETATAFVERTGGVAIGPLDDALGTLHGATGTTVRAADAAAGGATAGDEGPTARTDGPSALAATARHARV
ncbi:hypothetical protein ABTX77_38685 [Streptomyces sp. NPDC097704]|uniref:hypothetical protein n=1 Tax=Streptomyces sp. NPDC097704 TaxID=3157101 RepID=UPI0033168BCC